MKVKANGIEFNCRIEGKRGAPWVVFSNSLATNFSMWDDQAAALGDKFQILRYDQRGHGGTDAPEGKYSFDLLVADVIGLFDALEIERAHFVGLSMGGMTAVAFAEQTFRSARPRGAVRLRAGLDAAIGAAMGRTYRHRAREGHGGAGRADGRRAGFRPSSSPRTRRPPTRCGR